MVQMMRVERNYRHEIQHLQMQQVSLRRTLWDQQTKLGTLMAPPEVRRRAEEQALGLEPPASKPDVAKAPQPRPASPRRNTARH